MKASKGRSSVARRRERIDIRTCKAAYIKDGLIDEKGAVDNPRFRNGSGYDLFPWFHPANRESYTVVDYNGKRHVITYSELEPMVDGSATEERLVSRLTEYIEEERLLNLQITPIRVFA